MFIKAKISLWFCVLIKRTLNKARIYLVTINKPERDERTNLT